MLALHRLAPAALALALVLVSGCQSRDERVCEHLHELIVERLASYDKEPGDRKEGIESCMSVKAKLGATEEEWTAYLDCSEQTKVWADAEVCMSELAVAVGKRGAGL